MSGLYLLLPTLLVVVLSFLIVRAAAIALTMTGMDEQRARFQALSAFTGTGFTTREAEIVMNNPLRRRIVTWLMILGNAGIITVIVGATSSVVTSQGYHVPISIAILIVAIFGFWRLAKHGGLTRRWEKFIENRLLKSRAFQHGMTEDLFLVRQNYALMRVIATEDSHLVGSSLRQAILQRHDLLVLGIERGRKWLHLPQPNVAIEEGDRIIVYGRSSTLHRKVTES